MTKVYIVSLDACPEGFGAPEAAFTTSELASEWIARRVAKSRIFKIEDLAITEVDLDPNAD